MECSEPAAGNASGVGPRLLSATPQPLTLQALGEAAVGAGDSSIAAEGLQYSRSHQIRGEPLMFICCRGVDYYAIRQCLSSSGEDKIDFLSPVTGCFPFKVMYRQSHGRLSCWVPV
jgi:hypothetical protein